MNVSGRYVTAAVLLFLFLPASISRGEEAVSLEVKGYVSGYAASGNRKLDDERDIAGSNTGMQMRLRMPGELSLFADARYFSGIHAPEGRLREVYLNWIAGDLTLRAGQQIIIWGRADRFNPTDVITPRDYRVLSFDDDAQRFGVVGAEVTYRLSGEYTVSAHALPFFQTSRIPTGMLPAGTRWNPEHEHSSGDNVQWGVKLDDSSAWLDWSVSSFKGFSSLPELVLKNGAELVLENRAMRMIGVDFAASPGSWGIRGEASYIALERENDMPDLLPHSYFYSVLGVERNLAETTTLNVQWLRRQIFGFTDPRTVPGPLGQIAMGNAQIHNQFDKIQTGISISIRARGLHDALQAELSGVSFFVHHDYLIRPQLQYALNDHWSLLMMADIYHGPDDSFLGSLRKNSLAYAELRYQFGPFLFL